MFLDFIICMITYECVSSLSQPRHILYSIPTMNSSSSSSNNASNASELYFQTYDSGSLPTVVQISKSSNKNSQMDRTEALPGSRTLNVPSRTAAISGNPVMLNKIVFQSGCLSSKTNLPVLQHLPAPRSVAKESVKDGQSFVLCTAMAPSVGTEAEWKRSLFKSRLRRWDFLTVQWKAKCNYSLFV